MRGAAATMTRKRLGRDVFGRGCPRACARSGCRQFTAAIYDLLKAYSEQRKRTVSACMWFRGVSCGRSRRRATIAGSRGQVRRGLGSASTYSSAGAAPDIARTALASSFGATLEMRRRTMGS